jgi:protein-L-isoaspartate(D-aspartate) O-methyltransferase
MSDVGVDRLMRFLLDLRQRGVTDPRVLAAMEKTPRTHFAPDQFAAFALEDRALPIGEGQHMSSPSLVGRMLSALDLKGGETVIEVGSGSGYQAAVLGALARRVVSMERRQALAATARGKIGQLRTMHVYIHYADGAEGWGDEKEVDRIIVNASVVAPPARLVAQLATGGVLLAPVVTENGQRLVQFRKGLDGDLTAEDRGPIALEPLESGLAT